MSKLLAYAEQIGLLSRESVVAEDFHWMISPHKWTTLIVDAGSSAAVSAVGANGLLSLGTGAVDNNEAMIRSTNACWIFATGKTFAGEVLFTP